MKDKGKLPLRSYLRCRVRYFCDRAVFESKEFVEGMFRECRGWFGERFHGPPKTAICAPEPEGSWVGGGAGHGEAVRIHAGAKLLRREWKVGRSQETAQTGARG
jgi:hypothetical protein